MHQPPETLDTVSLDETAARSWVGVGDEHDLETVRDGVPPCPVQSLSSPLSSEPMSGGGFEQEIPSSSTLNHRTMGMTTREPSLPRSTMEDHVVQQNTIEVEEGRSRDLRLRDEFKVEERVVDDIKSTNGLVVMDIAISSPTSDHLNQPPSTIVHDNTVATYPKPSPTNDSHNTTLESREVNMERSDVFSTMNTEDTPIEQAAEPEMAASVSNPHYSPPPPPPPPPAADDSQSRAVLDTELLDLLDETNNTSSKRRKLSHDSFHTFTDPTPTISGTEAAPPQLEVVAVSPLEKKSSKPISKGTSRIRSSRAEMTRLENARYNDKGEIIEDESKETTPASLVISSMSTARPDPSLENPTVHLDMGIGVGSALGPASPVYNISRAEAKLLNARYNEKGEMIVDLPVEVKHEPKKKSSKKTNVVNDSLGSTVMDTGDKADGVAVTKTKSKGYSKTKSGLESTLDVDMMALLDVPSASKKHKKNKVVDEASSDRSGSVFTLADFKQESPAVNMKKTSKQATDPEASAESPMEPDDRLYCICKKPYNEDTDDVMLECDRCFNWYHLGCVGVSEDDVELLDTYICKDCEKDTEQRTTWKVKCKREGCRKGRDEPISKYCSESCGIHHVLSVISSQKLEYDQVWPAVEGALPPRGFAVHLNATGTVPSTRHPTAGARKARILALQQDVEALRAREADVDARMSDLDAAKKRLDSATEVYEALAPFPRVADSDSALKKQKKPKAPVSSVPMMDRLCAFDVRLIDGESADLGVGVGESVDHFLCQTVERKCRRHVDWQHNRQTDIQAYHSILTREKESLLAMIDQRLEELSKLDFGSFAECKSLGDVDVVMTAD